MTLQSTMAPLLTASAAVKRIWSLSPAESAPILYMSRSSLHEMEPLFSERRLASRPTVVFTPSLDSSESSFACSRSSLSLLMYAALLAALVGLTLARAVKRPAMEPSPRRSRRIGTPGRFWLARSGRFHPPFSTLCEASCTLRS